MADTRKIVKVFLASPGDLQDERRRAKSVVDEFNKSWAEHLGYHVELVGWEDTVSSFGRPQDIINQDLERCELLVGMMYRRWGTPPGPPSSYTSGFEEEFETSVIRRRETGKPAISLFFRNIEPDDLRDPGPELAKVIAFKNKIASNRILLYEIFQEVTEFESKFRACITAYVQKLQAQEAGQLSNKTQAAPQDQNAPPNVVDSESATETPLSVEGAQFLRDFITKTELPESPIEPVEVARFRLLGSIIGQQGNDDRSLNTHDANLIFARRPAPNLSNREIFGLIDCGLDHYSSETTPLWRWYAAVGGFRRLLLSLLSLNGTPTQQAGTLSAMRLISEPMHLEAMPYGPAPTREEYIGSWLSESASSNLKVAALGYLGDCGVTRDLPAIKAEFDKGNYQTSGAAVDALLRINLRDSREEAIAALYDLQPESVKDELVTAIFGNGESLSIDLISKGALHRSSAVRRVAVTLLAKSKALKLDVAEQLLSDSDAEVRFQALRVLAETGKSFSDEQAKAILVKPTRTGLGLLSLASASDSVGEGCWKRFRRERMLSMTIPELTKLIQGETIFERDAKFALIDREFQARGDALRASVDDRFKFEFSEALNDMARRLGAENDVVKKIKSLEEHLTKEFTRLALDIICRKNSPRDLGRIRAVLKSDFVAYSDADIEYLRKFGEWEDIPLIIASVKRPAIGLSLLSDFDESKYRLAARAIYHIGKARLAEVLTLDMPSQLLAYLIVEVPDKGFRSLTDLSLKPLLHAENDKVRKATALKCIRSLPKTRVRHILEDYTAGDASRYYNVIHWLDLGVSAPKDTAARAADKVIAADWR